MVHRRGLRAGECELVAQAGSRDCAPRARTVFMAGDDSKLAFDNAGKYWSNGTPGKRRAASPKRAPPAAAKPGPKSATKNPRIYDNLIVHALYMVTVGVFATRSTVNPKWRPNLTQRFTAYALSSLFYSAAGIICLLQLVWCPLASPPGWPTRYSIPEAVLVTLQGVWSYWSDVVAIGTTSIAHPIDRFSAVTLTFFQFYKFGILLWPAMDTPDKVWTSTTLAFAVVCKMADYHAMRANDISLYRRSHARAAGIEPRVGRVARTDALRSRVRARRVAVLVARLAAAGLRLVHHLFVGPQHPMLVGVVAFIGARASQRVCVALVLVTSGRTEPRTIGAPATPTPASQLSYVCLRVACWCWPPSCHQ